MIESTHLCYIGLNSSQPKLLFAFASILHLKAEARKQFSLVFCISASTLHCWFFLSSPLNQSTMFVCIKCTSITSKDRQRKWKGDLYVTEETCVVINLQVIA